MSDRKDRISAINYEIDLLNSKLSVLHAERRTLDLEDRKAEYPCECVRLNGDMEIYDMIQQRVMRRKALGLGLVSETLSARQDCMHCNGTGKPR